MTRVVLLLLLLSLGAVARANDVRRPPADAGFAISLSQPVLRPRPGIGVYELDLFDAGVDTIRALHAAGGYVVCYFSAGSFEDWRPDAKTFPAAVLGKDYSGWPGERWLDIRQRDALAPILEARLDLAHGKNCDAVDPANMDGFSNQTGFDIAPADAIAFARWIARAAHARGLAVGLKNASELVADLVDAFDFAVVESCMADRACAAFLPFSQQHKRVFVIEYRVAAADWAAACAAARGLGFTAILADQALDGKSQACP